MRIYDRRAGRYTEEKEFGRRKLEFLYSTVAGRVLLKLIFARHYYSAINGLLMRTKRSAEKIAPFVEEYAVDLSECEKTEFSSFDDFFTRKRSYHCNEPYERLISPADARLSAYAVDDEPALRIKNSVYSLEELTGGRTDLSAYAGGVCLVYRLAVEDYHRYVFIDSGSVADTHEIKGELHTVRPVSERYRVFSRNHRILTVLDTEHFGRVLQIEVGALQVGKINNHPVSRFERLDEKGYFSYGGSTIIQIFGRNAVRIDKDITDSEYEVLVRIGEGVGSAL